MADNLSISIAGGGTATVGTDDVGSVHYQRVKHVIGADGAADDVHAGNGMPIAGAYLELTGSASANGVDLVAATDVRQYRSVVLQLAGTFTLNVQVQVANDTTNWLYLPMVQAGGTTNLAPLSTISAAGLYEAPLNAKYLRVRTTGYTSGTASAILVLSAQPAAQRSVDTELPTAAAMSDALANPTVPMVGAAQMLYNGSTWDRPRTANSASNGAGLGVPAAGNMGYDGSAWQRIKASTAGELQTNQAGAGTSAVTSVAAATSSTSLLAANAARKQATVFNDSTANLYLKLGAAALTTSFTVKIGAGGYYELPRSGYTGAIDGIWDTANGAARITELT